MKEEKLVHDPFKAQLDQDKPIQKEKPKEAPKEPAQKEYLNRTLTIREDHLEKLRAKAWWDRKTQREILDEALEAYFKDKKVKPIPDKV